MFKIVHCLRRWLMLFVNSLWLSVSPWQCRSCPSSESTVVVSNSVRYRSNVSKRFTRYWTCSCIVRGGGWVEVQPRPTSLVEAGSDWGWSKLDPVPCIGLSGSDRIAFNSLGFDAIKSDWIGVDALKSGWIGIRCSQIRLDGFEAVELGSNPFDVILSWTNWVQVC